MTPEHKQQVAINGLLEGKVLPLSILSRSTFVGHVERHISSVSFEPNYVVMNGDQLSHSSPISRGGAYAIQVNVAERLARRCSLSLRDLGGSF